VKHWLGSSKTDQFQVTRDPNPVTHWLDHAIQGH
jgi:hypothetical protein